MRGGARWGRLPITRSGMAQPGPGASRRPLATTSPPVIVCRRPHPVSTEAAPTTSPSTKRRPGTHPPREAPPSGIGPRSSKARFPPLLVRPTSVLVRVRDRRHSRGGRGDRGRVTGGGRGGRRRPTVRPTTGGRPVARSSIGPRADHLGDLDLDLAGRRRTDRVGGPVHGHRMVAWARWMGARHRQVRRTAPVSRCMAGSSTDDRPRHRGAPGSRRPGVDTVGPRFTPGAPT